MTTDRLRKILALVVTALPVIAVVAAFATADLPDPVPSHWDASGAVDGTTGLVAFTVINLGATAIALLAALGFARSERPRYGLAACAFAAYLLGSLAVLTAAVASGAPTAQEVGLPWEGVALAVAAALLAPLLVWWLWPTPTARPDERPVAELPQLELGEEERVVYLAEVRSRGFAYLAAGCLLIGVIIALTADLLIGASVLAVTVAAAVLQRASVRIDVAGLRIGFGPGIRIKIPLDTIRQAAAQPIRPMEWGGWGYRVLPGRRAVVLRGGPGLVLDLTDGSRFAVTLDDPDQAAAVLNGLLDRSRQG